MICTLTVTFCSDNLEVGLIMSKTMRRIFHSLMDDNIYRGDSSDLDAPRESSRFPTVSTTHDILLLLSTSFSLVYALEILLNNLDRMFNFLDQSLLHHMARCILCP